MSGPSSGALEGATKILADVEIGPHAYDTLHARIAEGLQEKFDLGHKAAGGAMWSGGAPAMGGLLEIALDQQEIDVLWLRIRDEPALKKLVENIELFRSIQR